MKAKGIVRKIDELGRIVIPKEIREMHGIKNGDSVEILSDGDLITLTKFLPGCRLCGSDDNLIEFGGKQLCAACIAQIKEQL